jgi:hypothetical protein
MKKEFAGLILIGLSLVSLESAARAAEATKPNMLIILADDRGHGELSCQGNPQIPPPNIDSIARNGVRLTSGYVSAPYCSPTRAALLTGRYQQRFGHAFNPGPVGTGSREFGLSLNEPTDLGNGPKLFDLANDIAGQCDLAATNSANVQELKADYEVWNAKNIEARWKPNRNDRPTLKLSATSRAVTLPTGCSFFIRRPLRSWALLKMLGMQLARARRRP